MSNCMYPPLIFLLRHFIMSNEPMIRVYSIAYSYSVYCFKKGPAASVRIYQTASSCDRDHSDILYIMQSLSCINRKQCFCFTESNTRSIRYFIYPLALVWMAIVMVRNIEPDTWLECYKFKHLGCC